jgi:hypothetical protein
MSALAEQLLLWNATGLLPMVVRMLAMAFAAVAVGTPDVRVLFAVEVSFWALHLDCIVRRETVTSQRVHPACDWLDVVRIAAPPIPTEVIERQATWDRADQVLVDHSMSLVVLVVHRDLHVSATARLVR